MIPAEPLRRKIAAALAIVCAGVAAARTLPIEPFISFQISRVAHNDKFDTYRVWGKVRGGETLPEVRIEALDGRMQVDGGTFHKNALSGSKIGFDVVVKGGAREGDLVRVLQKGRVERTYTIRLTEWK